MIGWSPHDKIKIEAEHIAIEIDCGLNIMNGDDRSSSKSSGFVFISVMSLNIQSWTN